jgi:hypothetical protein
LGNAVSDNYDFVLFFACVVENQGTGQKFEGTFFRDRRLGLERILFRNSKDYGTTYSSFECVVEATFERCDFGKGAGFVCEIETLGNKV